MPAQATPPRLLEMRLTRKPRDPAWELRAGAGVQTALLGWVLDRPPVDAGVPDAVAGIVARAACRLHVVTFLHPTARGLATTAAWASTPFGWAAVVDPPALKRALGKSGYPLVATRDADTARELFRADDFDWDLRGQVVLLSARGAAPAPLDYSDVDRLFGKDPLTAASLRLPPGFTGLMLPGVDGGFVEIAGFDGRTTDTLAEGLALECAAASVLWRVVDEAEFTQTDWHGESRSS